MFSPNSSKILHIGCEKGFLLHDIKTIYPKMKIFGIEQSQYAISKSLKSVKKNIRKSSYTKLTFKNNEFDFVLAIGVVYSLNLTDAISCLKEIIRVFITSKFILII